jgi:hypothetical protein
MTCKLPELDLEAGDGGSVTGASLTAKYFTNRLWFLIGDTMDNDRLFKTLSEILAVASEISAINLRNQEIVEEFIAFEAQRDREHDALTAWIRSIETRLCVNHAV